MISPSPIYKKLGKTLEERQRKYIKLIESFMEVWEAIKERFHEECKYFIGSDSWVEDKRNDLRQTMREKYQKWKKYFKEREPEK
ncbi:MAG: hypothetical protein ABIA04_16075 [Pseudomonadota bacterium]